MKKNFPFAVKEKKTQTYFLILSDKEYISITFENNLKSLFHYRTKEIQSTIYLKLLNNTDDYENISFNLFQIKYELFFNLTNSDLNKIFNKHIN